MILILGKNFKFHSNLCIPANKVKRFLIYYKQIFKRWSENLSWSPSLPSTIAFEVIWYDKCIKVDNKTLYNLKISQKDIIYVGQLFKCDVKCKLWEDLKNEFNLQGQLHFIYQQIMNSIPAWIIIFSIFLEFSSVTSFFTFLLVILFPRNSHASWNTFLESHFKRI